MTSTPHSLRRNHSDDHPSVEKMLEDLRQKSLKSRSQSNRPRKSLSTPMPGRRPPSSRMLVTDDILLEAMDQSESSLNPLEDLDRPPPNSLNHSDDSGNLSHSHQASYNSQNNNSFQSAKSAKSGTSSYGRRRRSRERKSHIKELRREMSERCNKSTSSRDRSVTSPKHPGKDVHPVSMIRVSSPPPATTPTRRKKSPTRKSNPMSVDNDNKDKSPVQPKRTRGGNSMRNLLRNKRKLEQELNQSDIFQFVLHKHAWHRNEGTKTKQQDTPHPHQQHQHQEEEKVEEKDPPHRAPASDDEPTIRWVRSSRSRPKTRRQRGGRKKLSLDQFIVMKEQSESLAGDQEQPDHKVEGGNANAATTTTGHQTPASGEPSKVEPDEDDKGDSLRHEQEPSGDNGDDGSVTSLDLKAAVVAQPTNIQTTTNNHRQRRHHHSTSSSMEEMESQTLTLSMQDLHLEGDSDNNDNNTFPKKRVKNVSIIDPIGRQVVYTGPLSLTSGMPHGYGQLEYKYHAPKDHGDDGDAAFDEHFVLDALFVNGYATGFGRCLDKITGDEYHGYLRKSLKHGQGTMGYTDGRFYEGAYSQGAKTHGKMTYQDGSTYLGAWSRGGRHGPGTYIFGQHASSVYVGEFKDDQMHGRGVLTWVNGSSFEGHWEHGLRHGKGKEFRSNGHVRREGIWKNGKFCSSASSD